MIQEIYIIDDDETSVLVFRELFKNDTEYKSFWLYDNYNIFFILLSIYIFLHFLPNNKRTA